MSNTRVSYFEQKEIIRSFAESDEIFSVHQIHDVILPALLDNFVKMRNSVSTPEIHETSDASTGSSDLDDKLKRILEDFFDVKKALGRFKELELQINKQMRALLLPSVDDILIEIEEAEIAEEDARAAAEGRKAAEDARTVATEARISADEARRHLDKEEATEALEEARRAEEKALETEQAYEEQTDDTTSTVHTIPIQKIQTFIPELSKITSELKGNLIRLLPATTKPDDAQAQPSSATASNEHKEDDQEWLVKWADLDLQDESFCESLAFKVIEERYVNLKTTLKVCLLFLVIFPDNAVIKKTAVIYWWIGEGFLVTDPRSAKTEKETADELLEELMAKGFIEPVNKKRSPIVQRFRMNPFVRLVLLMLAKKKKLFDIDCSGNFIADCFTDSKRACLIRSEQGSSQYELRNKSPEYMQTLFNVNESYVDLTSFWVSRAKYLNVLHLGRWQGSSKNHIEVTNTEFLRTLGDLKHLRYINLQGISRIHELPSSISNLRHLKILDLRACHNLEKLPSGIHLLENLEYIDMSDCYLIGNMPVGLAALSKLQVLKGFVIGNPTANGHCKLSQLTKLSKLRKLSLNIYESMGDYIAEYELEHLGSFNQLRSLTVAWLGVPPPSKSRKATTKQLRPSLTYSRANTMSQLPPMLEKLDLRCYPYYELPRGLQGLERLKLLYIRGGQLRSLITDDNDWGKRISIIRLKFLIELEMIWPKLRSLFPTLVYFEKVNCPKLCLCPCDGRGVWRATRHHLSPKLNLFVDLRLF